MTTPQFPGRPNLEQLKHQAKDLLRAARALIEADAALPTEEQLEQWGSDEVIAVVLEAMRTRPRPA